MGRRPMLKLSQSQARPYLAVPYMSAQLLSSTEITKLLRDWSNGDKSALEKLVPLIETEIHNIAHRHMRHERSGGILQTTALIDEAYLRLIDMNSVQWQNRAHFFAICARIMRQVLVDYARNRNREKRGGGVIMIALEEAVAVAQSRGEDVIKLDEALKALAEVDQRKSQIVELLFFGGLSIKETAEVLKVSPRTVDREWHLARAWLYRELSKEHHEQ